MTGKRSWAALVALVAGVGLGPRAAAAQEDASPSDPICVAPLDSNAATGGSA